MKKLILILCFCVSSLANANGSEGTVAATEWLGLIDKGEYGESWVKADTFFRSQLSQEKWEQALVGVRAPLGTVISRKELSNTEYSELPGAPDGEYIVIQFQTSFQNKKSSVETLTLSKSSGQWQAVGYFIK